MSEPKIMRLQLVGRGDVVVLTMPGEAPISVAISDASFVDGISKLIQQAKNHPSSLLRRLRVDNER